MKKFLAILMTFCLLTGTLLALDGRKTTVYAGDLAKVNSMEELEEIFSDILYAEKASRLQRATKAIFNGVITDDAVAEASSDMMMAGAADVSDLSAAEQPLYGGTDSSETNTQVAGVDESDLIKTDGKYLYIMSSNRVRIMDRDMRLCGTIRLPEDELIGEDGERTGDVHFSDMYLADGKVVLIAVKYEYYSIMPLTGKEMMSAAADLERVMPAYYGGNNSYCEAYVYEIDDSGSSVDVRLCASCGVEGELGSSRKVGDIVYVVSTYYPSCREDLLPQIKKGGEEEGGEYEIMPLGAIDCYPGEKATGYSIITAFNVESGETNTKAIVHRSGEIYMNADELFLTEVNWSSDEHAWRPNYSTRITRFEIDGMNVGEGMVGEVEGSILNQFSMDSYNGIFRIATTTYKNGEDDWSWTEENNVFLLDTETMKVVGSLRGLAEGERIYAVRFMGDVGYMVTYETVDPLFVLDLSDPTAPSVTGELKIPGFSNYLHPISDKYLLGIGEDTQEIFVEDRLTGEKIVTGVRTNGMKISLFNVEDKMNPVEQDVYYLGYSGTWSEVSNNHKALLCYKNIFGFDVRVAKDPSGYGDYVQEAFLFTVTDKINPIAELAADDRDNYSNDEWFLGNRLCVMQNNLYYLNGGTLSRYDMQGFTKISARSL